MQLPSRTKRVVEEYLSPLNRGVPEEMLLLTHLVFISRVLCFNRVKIQLTEDWLFPNLYGMCFVPSGVGKDRTLNYVEKLYTDVRSAQQITKDVYKDSAHKKIDKYFTYEEENGNKLTAPQKQRYRDEHSPYTLVEEISNGTIEGLQAMRGEFSKAGIGSMHFSNSEFVDYISTGDATKHDFLSYLKAVYEKGDSVTKIIKKHKNYSEVRGVPQTTFVHSSLSGLVDNHVVDAAFRDFLERGNARRSIVCCPEKDMRPFKSLGLEEKTAATEKAMSYITEFRHLVYEAYMSTEPQKERVAVDSVTGETVFEYEYKVMELSADAQRMMSEYEETNLRKAHEMRDKSGDSLMSELKDRFRRALRLSACIAAFEHPGSLVITGEDYSYAKQMIEFYAKQFYSVLNLRRTLDSERLYDFILEVQDEEEITRTLIKKQKFAPTKTSQHKAWLDNIILELEDVCIERGVRLVEIIHAKNKKTYRIEECVEQHGVAASEDVRVSFSFTKSKQSHPVDGYKSYTRPFSTLHKALTLGFCYSPATFKEGYRKAVNVLAHGNCIMVDIDDGLTIEEAKSMLSEYHALIITTQSHGKDKGGVACDRFRILIPTGTEVSPECEYRDLITEVLKDLGLYEYADVAATCDQARYFKPSPKDAEYWYSSGKKLFAWESFDTGKKVIQSGVSPRRTTGLSSKAKPGAMFDVKGVMKSWSDFQSLMMHETTPVRCIFPEEHKNGDKNPSAFIGRHQTEEKLMFKCTGCGSEAFEN